MPIFGNGFIYMPPIYILVGCNQLIAALGFTHILKRTVFRSSDPATLNYKEN